VLDVPRRIVRGLDTLPAASEASARPAPRRRAAGRRLACQLRPARETTSSRSWRPATPRDHLGPDRQGVEQEVAVLFADLRGFTRMAERRLPYDVVYLLNRYFQAVGSAIERAGGIANQFTGDGVMALFGVERGRRPAAASPSPRRRMIAGLTP